MMKEQFTQGDWDFQANDSYIELHAGGKQIGDLCMGQNTCTESEIKANAHLIAAAPKMYRMLREIKEKEIEIASAWGNKLYMAASHLKAAKDIESLLVEARGEK